MYLVRGEPPPDGIHVEQSFWAISHKAKQDDTQFFAIKPMTIAAQLGLTEHEAAKAFGGQGKKPTKSILEKHFGNALIFGTFQNCDFHCGEKTRRCAWTNHVGFGG